MFDKIKIKNLKYLFWFVITNQLLVFLFNSVQKITSINNGQILNSKTSLDNGFINLLTAIFVSAILPPIIEEFTFRFWLTYKDKYLYLKIFCILVFIYETLNVIVIYTNNKIINNLLNIVNFNPPETIEGYQYENELNNYRYLIVPLMLMPIVFIFNKYFINFYKNVIIFIQKYKLEIPVIIFSTLIFVLFHDKVNQNLDKPVLFTHLISLIFSSYLFVCFRIFISFKSAVLFHSIWNLFFVLNRYVKNNSINDKYLMIILISLIIILVYLFNNEINKSQNTLKSLREKEL